MIDPQHETIELLATHEEAISTLYAAYAARFEEHRAFWRGISQEEIQHAEWIRRLKVLADQGEVHIATDRFRLTAIETSKRFVEGELERARSGNLTSIQAFSVARSLETGLIEKEFFTVFESDSPVLKEVLTKVAAATRVHGERLQEAWNMARGDAG